MNLDTAEKSSKKHLEIKKHRYCEHPKVSAIVPVYKVDQYLTKCLSSIVNQTMEELEIIIVDEGDQDRCREIIDYFERTDPRIVTIHQKNGGYGASCNLGIDIARGEFLAFIESDDFIELEMFEEMFNYAKELNADVVKTPYYDYYSNGIRYDCPHRMMLEESLPQYTCFSMKEYGEFLQIHASLWSCIYKNKYMKEKNIRFVEAKGAGYVDCVFRVETLIHTNKVAWMNKPYYNHRVDSLGSSTNNFNLSTMLMRWKEVHELCDQEDYLKYYGPRLIIEEYNSSLCKPWMMKVTPDEYKQMVSNLSFSSENMIKNSPTLNESQKKDLLELKKSATKFKAKVTRYQRLKKAQKMAENLLNKVSNPILLLWLFVGFMTSLFVTGAARQDVVPENFEAGLLKAGKTFAPMFLLGIMCCFTGKVLRKSYYLLLDFYYKRRQR